MTSSIQCSRTFCAKNSEIRLFLCVLRMSYLSLDLAYFALILTQLEIE